MDSRSVMNCVVSIFTGVSWQCPAWLVISATVLWKASWHRPVAWAWVINKNPVWELEWEPGQVYFLLEKCFVTDISCHVSPLGFSSLWNLFHVSTGRMHPNNMMLLLPKAWKRRNASDDIHWEASVDVLVSFPWPGNCWTLCLREKIMWECSLSYGLWIIIHIKKLETKVKKYFSCGVAVVLSTGAFK